MIFFVADDIKPILFPILEDTSTVEKIRQLQAEFPVVIMEPLDLLLGVINRDPNLVSAFSKAAAIDALGSMDKTELSDDLIAQVFNPDELVSELAALQVSRMDKARFTDVVERLSTEQKNRLTKQVRDVEDGWENLVWDRIHLLLGNKYLKGLSTRLLYRIALGMELVHLMPEQSFDLVGENGRAKAGILRSGRLNLLVDDNELGSLDDLRPPEGLEEPDECHQRGVLQEADRIVQERWDHPSDGLRQDDVAHRLPCAETQ